MVAVGGCGVGVETATVGAGVAVVVGVSTTSTTICSVSAGVEALRQAVKVKLQTIRPAKSFVLKDLMSSINFFIR
jgi:hypothetical protein